MSTEECVQRLRLADEYSQAVSEFSLLLQILKGASHPPDSPLWSATESAGVVSQKAWVALEAHLADHRCLELEWPDPVVGANSMESAEIILVANDERLFVDMNQAAEAAFALTRDEVIGRRIEELFSRAQDVPIPAAWVKLITDGSQAGVCEFIGDGRRRKFEYRAKTNFAPGLHLSVLREVT